MAQLKAAVKALTGDDDTAESEYPAWEPWNGINDNYQSGAIVSHNGQLWQSTYEGQNVWEPGTVGDNFWREYPV